MPRLLLLQTLSALVITISNARQPCHICGPRGNEGIKFPDVIISNTTKTCVDIMMSIAQNVKDPLSATCKNAMKKWSFCCNGVKPPGITRDSTNLPPQRIPTVTYTGPHPVCHICRDKDYPSMTSMVIHYLYMGAGTCTQYWVFGQEGRIKRSMCSPVQFYAYEPCGCGKHNPYFKLET